MTCFTFNAEFDIISQCFFAVILTDRTPSKKWVATPALKEALENRCIDRGGGFIGEKNFSPFLRVISIRTPGSGHCMEFLTNCNITIYRCVRRSFDVR